MPQGSDTATCSHEVCDGEVEVQWIGWREAESRVSSIEAKMGSVCLQLSRRRCLSAFQGRIGVADGGD